MFKPVKEQPENLTRKLAARSVHIVRNDGFISFLSALRTMILYRLHNRVLDRLVLNNNEPAAVSQTTQLNRLTILSDHRSEGVEYTPTPHMVINLLHSLVTKDLADWTFVDIGAGRARVVMGAAKHNYKAVIGIEFALELQREAQRNIASLPAKIRKAGNVEIIHADATTFDVPQGQCIFYLFNPFAPPVLRKFLENIIASHQSEPRQMRIVYFNPLHAEIMTEFAEIRKCGLPLMTGIKVAALSPHRLELYEIVTV